jgi:hypothetical protein
MEDLKIKELLADLESIGLVCPLSSYGVEDVTETTTSREAKNGTRSFLDEKTGISYKSYSCGYVRRRKKETSYWRANSYWPLNPRKKTVFIAEQTLVCYDGNTYTIKSRTYKSYLLVLNEEERLKMIAENIKGRRK